MPRSFLVRSSRKQRLSVTSSRENDTRDPELYRDMRHTSATKCDGIDFKTKTTNFSKQSRVMTSLDVDYVTTKQVLPWSRIEFEADQGEFCLLILIATLQYN